MGEDVKGTETRKRETLEEMAIGIARTAVLTTVAFLKELAMLRLSILEGIESAFRPKPVEKPEEKEGK